MLRVGGEGVISNPICATLRKVFFPGRVTNHFIYCCASIYFFLPNYLFLNHSIYSAIMMLVPYPYYTVCSKNN